MSHHIKAVLWLAGVVAVLACAPPLLGKTSRQKLVVTVLTRNQERLEGTCADKALQVDPGRPNARSIQLRDIRSINVAAAAGPVENRLITDGIVALAGSDLEVRESVSANITDIGIPALAQVLGEIGDTDIRESKPLYRLFSRIVPGYADTLDMTLDFVRLADGNSLRGRVSPFDVGLTTTGGKSVVVSMSNVRTIAVRNESLERTFDVQAAAHATTLEFWTPAYWLRRNPRSRWSPRDWRGSVSMSMPGRPAPTDLPNSPLLTTKDRTS